MIFNYSFRRFGWYFSILLYISNHESTCLRQSLLTVCLNNVKIGKTTVEKTGRKRDATLTVASHDVKEINGSYCSH